MEQKNVIATAIPEVPAKAKPVANEADKLSSTVLNRLIEEVKFDNQNNIVAYNRTHNRHNRGR